MEAHPFPAGPALHCRIPTVSILRCADGTLYTGYALDLAQRCAAHNAGRGARYTAGRRPVTVVYAEPCDTVSDALKREHALKRLSRAAKESLIAGSAAAC